MPIFHFEQVRWRLMRDAGDIQQNVDGPESLSTRTDQSLNLAFATDIRANEQTFAAGLSNFPFRCSRGVMDIRRDNPGALGGEEQGSCFPDSHRGSRHQSYAIP